MAGTLETGIVDGLSYRSGPDGAEVIERVRVSGLSGTTASMVWSAISELPSKGANHGTFLNMRLDEHRLAEVQGNAVMFDLVYRTPRPSGGNLTVGDDPIIEIGGSLERTVTNVDKDGNLLLIDYEPSGLWEEPIPEHGVEVGLDRPRPFIRYTRRETITGAQLMALIRSYVGTTNSTTFAGFAARTLFMGPIFGRSDDGGETYLVSYEMYDNEDEWKARVVAVYDNGKIPSGVAVDNGVKDYYIFPETNFNSLNL